MSDSKNLQATKLRRPINTTTTNPRQRPSNLDIIDDAWAADKLSDDELSLTKGEAAITSILDDEGELDDGIVTTANSGSAATGALERRRKEEGRWNDLGLDLFEKSLTQTVPQDHPGTQGGGG